MTMKQEPDANPISREELARLMEKEAPEVRLNRFGNLTYYFSNKKVVGMEGANGIIYVEGEL